MVDGARECILEGLIIDLTTDIHRWQDLQKRIGLSEEYSKEMFGLIREVYNSYNGNIRMKAEALEPCPYKPSHIMRYFAYNHLPGHLQSVSEPIAVVAEQMDVNLPECEEKHVGLRKLLEAKDCFVRAALEK